MFKWWLEKTSYEKAGRLHKADRNLIEIVEEVKAKNKGRLPSRIEVIIPPDSEEWFRMWDNLSLDPLNLDARDLYPNLDDKMSHPEDPDTSWLYGSTVIMVYGIYMYPVHWFRHYRHPATNEMEDLYINASSEWMDAVAKEWIN